MIVNKVGIGYELTINNIRFADEATAKIVGERAEAAIHNILMDVYNNTITEQTRRSAVLKGEQ
jgi:hypothetical protein